MGIFSFAHTQTFRISTYNYPLEGELEPITGKTLGMILCYRGACSITTDENTYELTTGMACFALCRNYLRISCRNKTRSTLATCLTDLGETQNAVILQLRELPPLFPARDHLRKLFKLATRLEHIDNEITEEYRNILGEAIFSECLYSMDKHLSLKEYPNVVINLKEYIEGHYMKNCSLDFLARKFGFSARYLSTVFKKHTGNTPIDYLWKIRREKALELLCNTDSTLEHISTACGFKNYYHFSKHMKRHFIYGPSELRQRYIYDNSSISD